MVSVIPTTCPTESLTQRHASISVLLCLICFSTLLEINRPNVNLEGQTAAVIGDHVTSKGLSNEGLNI